MTADDWKPIATKPRDEVALLGWWLVLSGGARGWEVDVDRHIPCATHWIRIVRPQRPSA